MVSSFKDSLILNNLRIQRSFHKPGQSWPIDNDTLKALLGVKGKLPSEGVEPVMVQNVRVWVLSKAEVSHRDVKRPHRIMAACPKCWKTVPASRLQQHRCD